MSRRGIFDSTRNDAHNAHAVTTGDAHRTKTKRLTTDPQSRPPLLILDSAGGPIALTTEEFRAA